jgi:sulfite reductase alpha subunit-like flavoprotein
MFLQTFLINQAMNPGWTIMKSGIWRGLAVLCICSLPLYAFTAGEAAASDQPAAKSESLRDLRKAMDKAQDRFLSLYNRVNRDTDQRLSCSDSAPTGSRLTQRSCSTRAQTRAQEELARNYLGAMDNISSDQSQRAANAAAASDAAQTRSTMTSEQSAALAGAQSPDSDVNLKGGEAAGKISQEALEFEQNLQKLFEKHPDLKQRYDEFLTARQRYLDAGGRP